MYKLDQSVVTLYHGTSQRAWSKIKTEGFKVKSEATVFGVEHHYVYFTPSLIDAKRYANWAAERHKSDPIIIKAQIKGPVIVYEPEDSVIINDGYQVLTVPDRIINYKPVEHS